MAEFDDVCVVSQPISSGSEPHVNALLEILGALTTASLITSGLPQDSTMRERYEVVDVSTTGTGSTVFLSAFRFLRNQLRMAQSLLRRDESIVLFFGTTSYLIPILAAKLVGKTVVLEPRGDVPLTLQLQWEKQVPTLVARLLAGAVRTLENTGYRLADAIITYTPSMAKELGLDRFEEKLYPNGARYVDTETFYPRVPFEDRGQVVGFLGRLEEEKQIRELAAVAKTLPEEITFVFAGDGELREWLEEELTAEIEAGSVELTGWVDHEDVPAVLSRLRLLVLPSQPTEGLPTVILESMACGTPVYATPVSGVPDVVQDGETGFLINRSNQKLNVDSLLKILKRKDLNKISDSGMALIKKEYSFKAAAERYERILKLIS